MIRPSALSRLLAAVSAAALLAGCGTAVSGRAVSVFEDPFKVGGLAASDGPTGLRPDAKAESREVTGTDGGEVDQHLVYVDAQGRLDARQVRRIGVPSPLTQCVADSANATVYAAEEGVGIWRFSADPESDVSAALLDSPGRGHFEEEVGGVALYDGGEGARWLLHCGDAV